MKYLVPLYLLALSVQPAFADGGAPTQWTCYAQGEQNFGGPVGEVWQTVTGTGATQLDATDQAQQNCFSQGLQMCMVNNCWEN
jgi:hypothetical protein